MSRLPLLDQAVQHTTQRVKQRQLQRDEHGQAANNPLANLMQLSARPTLGDDCAIFHGLIVS